MLKLLDQATGMRVLVVGDVMLDEYLWGEAARLSAEAPVPVVEVGRRTDAAGGAGNVAANVAALGAAAVLGACVGADEAGARLRATLDGHGVDVDGVVVLADRPTTVKTHVVAQRRRQSGRR